MSCKLCEILTHKEGQDIAYETEHYIVLICKFTKLPILILKEHKEFIDKDLSYQITMEFGNFAEDYFGVRHLTINRKQSHHFKHLIWIASQIDHKLEKYPGFLEQWTSS